MSRVSSAVEPGGAHTVRWLGGGAATPSRRSSSSAPDPSCYAPEPVSFRTWDRPRPHPRPSCSAPGPRDPSQGPTWPFWSARCCRIKDKRPHVWYKVCGDCGVSHLISPVFSGRAARAAQAQAAERGEGGEREEERWRGAR
eukprot:3724566-Rhodomonas_salina.1